MNETTVVQQSSPAPTPIEASDAPAARAPFVPPAITDLGGLTGLTQLGGTGT